MVQLISLLFTCGFGLSVILRPLLIMANRNWFKQGFMGDSSIHWVLVKTIKGNRNFDLIPQYLIGCEPSSYPRSFHHFAALFPIELIRSWSGFPILCFLDALAEYFFIFAYYASVTNLPNIQTTILAKCTLRFFPK